MRNTPAYRHNIWMHLYSDKYQELLSYCLKQTGNDKELADEMVRTLSASYFANEQKLKEELNKLPSDYREVLELHFLHSMPVKEIPDKLPLTVYQVKRRIQVGIHLIRQNINPAFYQR